MARIARVVAPKYPHHIVQRGNRRQQVFFVKEDYELYLRLLKFYSRKFNLKVACYCLMPNHVHIIGIPQQKEGLAQAIGETHRNYTTLINRREKWAGYLWQGRFRSYILDEAYLISATRYILLNPVRASMVRDVSAYEWSSIKVHLGKKKDDLIEDSLLQKHIKDWHSFLSKGLKDSKIHELKKHERTGRPLGGEKFIERLEQLLHVRLRKQKPGRKSPIEQ